MRTFFLPLLTFLLLLLFSCGGKETNSKDSIPGAVQNQSSKQVSLAGKVYQTSDGMDSACKTIVRPTDYFQTLLFVNDSVFVQIQNTCCGGDDTVEFGDAYYSRGIYRLDEKELTLLFAGEEIVHYVKGTIEPAADNAIVFTERFETEKRGASTVQISHLDCGETPYFRYTNDGPKGDYLSPVTDTTHAYRTELEKSGVWKKLFPEKK